MDLTSGLLAAGAAVGSLSSSSKNNDGWLTLRFKFREVKGRAGEIGNSDRIRCGGDDLGGESRVRSKKLDLFDVSGFVYSLLTGDRGSEGWRGCAEGGGGGGGGGDDRGAAPDEVGTPDRRRSIASSRRRR